MSRVATGLDVWARDGFSVLAGKRVGAIVNATSVDCGFRHLADLLHRSAKPMLTALFGPEHGVRGQAQYMEAVGGSASDLQKFMRRELALMTPIIMRSGAAVE